MKNHELLGTPVKYIATTGGKQYDAFVAAIDEKTGFTLHLEDKEEGLRDKVCNKLGECWCINLTKAGRMSVKWTSPNIWRVQMDAIRSGRFDADAIYSAAGVIGGGAMASCAFR